MLNKLLLFFVRIVPASFHKILQNHYFGEHFNITYSQEGEDMIIKRWFGNQNQGFYVDIGAYHPVKYSNTYQLYRRGWVGLNIDALPGSMEAFRQKRFRDINLELAIDSKEGLQKFYVFNNPTLNTFDHEQAFQKNGRNGWKIIREEYLPTWRLDSVFRKHLTDGRRIDLMSIDVEGNELNVLRSNNWKVFRPSVLIVEMLRLSIAEILNSEIHNYLSSEKYVLAAKTANSVFYVSQERISIIKEL